MACRGEARGSALVPGACVGRGGSVGQCPAVRGEGDPRRTVGRGDRGYGGRQWDGWVFHVGERLASVRPLGRGRSGRRPGQFPWSEEPPAAGLMRLSLCA